MTPAELFTRCGKALCGDGPRWKEQLAGMLDMRTNTIDNMSKGTSRIPPGVWLEIRALIQVRYAEILPRLLVEIDGMRESEPLTAANPNAEE